MEVSIDGFIYQHQHFGGISRIFKEILPRMCDFDPSLNITILTSGRWRQPLPIHRNITHRRLFPTDDLLRPRRFWMPIQLPARRLVQSMALNSIDRAVWHSTYFTTPMRWNGPRVTTVYDMIYERYSNFFPSPNDERFRKRKRESILTADAVICISETTRADVQRYYGVDDTKLTVVPLAYNKGFRQLEPGSASNGLRKAKPFVLYVGRRGSYKNFITLLKAYCVWKRREEIDLVVVGPDWSAQEKGWLVQWGCQEQVHLLQQVDDELLNCLYNQAQAFVYPSLFEGFGIPLLEAMACGCPVVASSIPTTVEIAEEHPFYFEPTDVDSLLDALERALSYGHQPEKIAVGKTIAQGYSWDRCAAQTLQVYRFLTNSY